MYSESQGFQQLAAQAMTASNVIQTTERLSEASECPSTGSRFADEGYTPMPSSPPLKSKDRYTSRFTNSRSMHPRDSNIAQQQQQIPDTINNTPLLHHGNEQLRATAKYKSRGGNRRSDHAYAPRRSWVPASLAQQGNSSKRSSHHVRQSVASVLTASWAGEDEVDALDWSTDNDHGNTTNSNSNSSRSTCSLWQLFCYIFPLAFSLIMVLGGVLFLVYGSNQMIDKFQIWRLCFFLAALPLIWYIGKGVTQGFVWMVEKSMFRMQNALYYAYAVRKPLANVLRAILTLSWWAISMTIQSKNQDQGVKDAVQIVLKILGCITLFMTANLLKTLLAKLLSSKFNKESHLQKIQDSLVKEYYLHMLLEPRERSDVITADDADTLALYNNNSNAGNNSGGTDRIMKHSPLTTATATTHHVHAMSHTAAQSIGSALANSVRGVKSSLFGVKHQSPKELETVSEELLNNSDSAQQSPNEVAVDVEAALSPQPSLYHHSTTIGVQQQQQSAMIQDSTAARNINNNLGGGNYGGNSMNTTNNSYLRKSSTTTERLNTINTTTNNNNNTINHSSYLRKSSSERLLPTSRQHSTASHSRSSGAHTGGYGRSSQRAASVHSRFNPTRRPSKLTPLMEGAASDQTQKRGLTANQLAKMEQYIRKNALQVTFRDELNATERQEAVTSKSEAKKLAFYLFWNVKADLERTYLIPDDIADFLPDEDVDPAFSMLDHNCNGQVSLQECIAAVLSIYEARCDLAMSLKDTKSVVGKLENVIGVVIHIIFVFFYMLVFQIDVIKTYLALSSLVLAFSFIFQNSIRTMYENVVFLFVVHPFDVGDVLQIGEGDPLPYKVDQIDLHYTVMIAPSGARTWYPNQKLMGSAFANISASGERSDSIKVQIDIDTPARTLEAVRMACEALALSEPTEFGDSVSLHLRDATTPMKITLAIGYKYSHNCADAGRCAKARTLMHAALCEALTQHGVQYTNPPTKDVGAVAVESMPTIDEGIEGEDLDGGGGDEDKKGL